MTREQLHKKVKQFVYEIIMIFKNYEGTINEALINEIVQSATRMSAHCREACDSNEEERQFAGFAQCKQMLDEILYLLNLLDNTKTLDVIKTETIILEAVDLKQIIEELCNNTHLFVEN